MIRERLHGNTHPRAISLMDYHGSNFTLANLMKKGAPIDASNKDSNPYSFEQFFIFSHKRSKSWGYIVSEENGIVLPNIP